MLNKAIFTVLPAVNAELDHWWSRSGICPDDLLRVQAQNSLRYKKFHVQGGAVYALRHEKNKQALIRIIVALQTISDYLDNLCDRSDCYDEKAFRQLHLSMADALSPGKKLEDYYKYYPLKNDGGYLSELVSTCRGELKNLPSYGLVQPKLLHYISLYSNLQEYKHVVEENREGLLIRWIDPILGKYPGIHWWEFAAATGSTLLIFALLSSAQKPDLTNSEAEGIEKAYFPWICGLHILLDYFIDQEEDVLGHDFNFVGYYANNKVIRERFGFFVDKSVQASQTLSDRLFHITIVKGLLALYLSDPKASEQKIKTLSRDMLRHGGAGAFLMHKLCRLIRKAGIV